MRGILFAAAFLGLTSVIAGAAGDHAVAAMLDEIMTKRFDTALRYHQLYAVLLLILAFHGQKTRLHRRTALIFLYGVLLFSGTLYLSVFLNVPGLIYAVPVGGMLLMAGWASLIFDFLRKKDDSAP